MERGGRAQEARGASPRKFPGAPVTGRIPLSILGATVQERVGQRDHYADSLGPTYSPPLGCSRITWGHLQIYPPWGRGQAWALALGV